MIMVRAGSAHGLLTCDAELTRTSEVMEGKTEVRARVAHGSCAF